MGLRGAMITIGQRSGASYGDPKFEKFWSAAETLEVPISLHVAASETTWMNTGNRNAPNSAGCRFALRK